MEYFNNAVFLTGGSDKTTGSDFTVTGEKGGSVITEGGKEVEQTAPADTSKKENDVQSNTNSETAVADNNTAEAQGGSGGFFGGGTLGLVLVYGVFIAVFYFLVLRPQKRRQNEMKELVNSLEVGDDIVTSSGYYGKITDIGEDVCVVEFGTNKGVRIPVKKSEIIKKEVPKFN